MKFIKKLWNYYRTNGLVSCFKALYKKALKKNKNSNEKMKNFVLSIKENEKEEVSLKGERIKNIFVFATVPYYDVGGGQRSSQISKIFNNMGYSVYYIYAFDSSESKIFSISMPLVMHKNINNVSNYEFSQYIKKDDICIFEAPCEKFDRFLEISFKKKAKIVYENIDNWETSLGSMVYNEKTLINMLKQSDMITATAGLLVEQTAKYFEKYKLPKKQVIYLPNAVDDELFEPLKNYEKPKDLIKGEKTLIYYGSLWGEWFDWELIDKVARTNDKVSINLIGDYSSIKDKMRKLPSNVHFLGLKKQTDLPAYLVYSDYAILPFKRCDIGNYVSPLKIFEYISMNKTVLATNLPDIIGYPNVYNFDSADEWTKIISKDIIKVDIKRRNDFIQENNWYNRCSNILNIVLPENSLKLNNKFYNNISVVVLNYNNKNVIFRCVDTLLKFNSRYKYEVIVVDNNSTDGSYELLKNKYSKKIKILKNDKNGCASGRNIGVAAAKNDYILFLDSDQWILHDYWLDIYLKILDDNSFVGAVAWSAGWFNKKGYAYKYVDWYEHRYLYPNMLYRKDVGYLATCGFIMKRSTFNQIGGFDTYYDPTCYEDTDLSVSIRNMGLETVYSTYLGVAHIPHQTTKSGSEAHLKLLMQKGEYFRKKWLKINKRLLSDYIRD